MKPNLLIVSALSVLAMSARSANVVWPGATLAPDLNDTYFIGTYVPPTGGGVITLIIETAFPTDHLSPDPVLPWTAGAGQIWYLAGYGDAIDAAAANAADPLADSYNGIIGQIDLTINDPFYLSYWLGDSGAPGSAGSVYGWAQLIYDGTTLSLLDSAAETTGVGLYTGTYIPIPEPGTLALALTSVLALGIRRLRRRS